jgi:hypothetical protein
MSLPLRRGLPRRVRVSSVLRVVGRGASSVAALCSVCARLRCSARAAPSAAGSSWPVTLACPQSTTWPPRPRPCARAHTHTHTHTHTHSTHTHTLNAHARVLRTHQRRQAAGVPNEAMPSYCCWEGVFCCLEHSIYAASAATPCDRYSVAMLQLRGANITGVQYCTTGGACSVCDVMCVRRWRLTRCACAAPDHHAHTLEGFAFQLPLRACARGAPQVAAWVRCGARCISCTAGGSSCLTCHATSSQVCACVCVCEWQTRCRGVACATVMACLWLQHSWQR